MDLRITEVQKDFKATRSKLERKINNAEEEDRGVDEKGDELPAERAGDVKQASVEKQADTQHSGIARF